MSHRVPLLWEKKIKNNRGCGEGGVSKWARSRGPAELRFPQSATPGEVQATNRRSGPQDSLFSGLNL